MRKKIFLRCMSVTVLAVLLMFASGMLITYLNGRSMIRERLKAEMNLIESLLVSEDDCSRLAQFTTEYQSRVTVIAQDGTVIADSETDASEMGNHLDREEVKSALLGEPKAVQRYSSTFNCNMTYYAETKELSSGKTVIVRLAVKSSELSGYFSTAVPFLLITLGVSVIVAAIISDKTAQNMIAKIDEIGVSLHGLNKGRYKPLSLEGTESEFCGVFREINRLNESTDSYIKSVVREREKLDNVLDNILQGIIALNGENEVEFVNSKALEMLSSDKKEIGSSLQSLIGDGVLCERIVQEIAEGGSFEYGRNGQTFLVAVKRIEEQELQKTLSCTVILTDITAEREIIRQKSDFFANASHELKTPITVVRGLAEILLTKDMDSGYKKHIERMHSESIRLAVLIEDMLKLSRLERSAEEDVRVPVALDEVVKEVLSELNQPIVSKNITARLSGEGKVFADPRKIFELVQNLCSNAVNYNVENGRIDVRIEREEGAVVLTVADGGIGIEKKHLPRICERFYRVDKSRSKKTGGTGLGLAIVKHICALYNANLSFESEIGVGTCVRVAFSQESGIN